MSISNLSRAFDFKIIFSSGALFVLVDVVKSKS